MKNTVMYFLGAAAQLGLSACDSASGQLNVTKPLSAVVDGKSVTFAAGTYAATIEGSANLFRKELAIDLTVNGGEQKILLKVPSNVSVPKNDGELKLSAAQSGQPFDLDGNVATSTEDGPEQAGVESCTRTETEERCDQHGCFPVTITINGQQEVRFFYRDMIRDVSAQLSASGSPLAAFTGRRVDTSKEYTYQGLCY